MTDVSSEYLNFWVALINQKLWRIYTDSNWKKFKHHFRKYVSLERWKSIPSKCGTKLWLKMSSFANFLMQNRLIFTWLIGRLKIIVKNISHMNHAYEFPVICGCGSSLQFTFECTIHDDETYHMRNSIKRWVFAMNHNFSIDKSMNV